MERWSKEELDNFVQDLQPIRFGKGCRSDRGGRPRNMQGIPRVLLFRLIGEGSISEGHSQGISHIS